MNRERWDNFCEQAILLLILAALIFAPLATGAVRTQDFLVIEALTLGAAALWMFRLWLSPRPQILWPPICWAVLAFACHAAIGCATADVEYVSRAELARILVYALLFFVTLNNLHGQRTTLTIALTLIFTAMAISFYALYQFATDSDRVWHFISPYKHRAGGTYICPNHLAGFLEMILPLALAHTVASRLKIPLKILLGYAAAVMMAGIAVTLSRGGWIATAAALSLFCALLVWRRNFRLSALAALAAVIAVATFFLANSTTVQLRLSKIVSENKDSAAVENIRFQLWRPALELWRTRPLAGIGPGLFDENFHAVRPQSIQMRPEHVHNDYIEILAEYGLVGAAILTAALAFLCLGIIKSWKFVRGNARDLGANSSNKFAFILGAAVSLLALLVHSAVDFNLHVPANAILATILAALASSHLRFTTADYWQTPRLGLKILITSLLTALIVLLGIQGQRAAREFFCLQKAQSTPEFSPARVTALKKAAALEPENFTTAFDIGDALRVESMEANADYAPLAQEAIQWLTRSLTLNPHHAESCVRRGMCLDWLDQPAAATADFARAEKLDPNGSFTCAHIGWHEMHAGNYAIAREWFARSLNLQQKDNLVASSCLKIVNRRLAEAAAEK